MKELDDAFFKLTYLDQSLLMDFNFNSPELSATLALRISLIHFIISADGRPSDVHHINLCVFYREISTTQILVGVTIKSLMSQKITSLGHRLDFIVR